MRMRATSCRTSARGPLVALVLSVVVLMLGARSASAQTPFVPYFGKNNIHYDNFDWHIYPTDHFEIYYYTDLEKHLERVAGYAEGAYQQVSADLKHDLSFKVPLILFKTHSEFEQQNVAPGAAQEGVGAFAEPFRDRMVLPIDEPPDLLYRLIVHELTHIFEFDIIPQGLIRRSVPLWVNEGLSDYERGQWAPLDLMMIRDAAVADIVPKMSDLQGYGNSNNPRLIYNLGHAVFEFIEAKFGKEGIRQFLFALRKSVIGGGDDAYEEAFKMKPEEFDQNFERYPQGSVQAVPRQGTSGGLRHRPRAGSGEDAVLAGAVDFALAVGRPDCGRHDQPQGRRARRRADLVERRLDGAQPHAGLRQELRLHEPGDAGRALEHDAVAGVVAEGRSARLPGHGPRRNARSSCKTCSRRRSKCAWR